MTRHNLLFVLADQLGAKYLGTYGHPDVNTPCLDRFANDALRFSEAYSASPVCTPYRGTLFTGRYPCQTGIINNGDRLPEEEITLASLLNSAGYHTAYVGKWHLSGEGRRWVPPEARGGFQEFLGWESHHEDHWKGLAWEDDPDKPITMPGHETDALTDIACRKLNQLAARRDPWCLFVAYQAPHPPCAPPEAFLSPYEDKQLTLPPNAYPDAFFDSPWGEHTDADIETFRRRYFGEISHLDANFQRLIDRLHALGLWDDTIVVFTSDHGEMAGSHGLFQKGVMYQESIQVPLLIRHPHGARGQVTQELFSSIDLFPTILSLCGVEPPDSAEGIDYAPLISGAAQDQVRTFFVAQHRHLCIRRGPFKLITDLTARECMALFDLDADPYERSNLLLQLHKKHRDIARSLQEELQLWLQDVGSRRV